MKYLELSKLTPEQGYVFASFSETWDEDKTPRRGAEKIQSIHGQKVVNTRTILKETLDSKLIIDSIGKSNKSTRI